MSLLWCLKCLPLISPGDQSVTSWLLGENLFFPKCLQTSWYLPRNLWATTANARSSVQYFILLYQFYLTTARNLQQTSTNRLGNAHFSSATPWLPGHHWTVSRPVWPGLWESISQRLASPSSSHLPASRGIHIFPTWLVVARWPLMCKWGLS